MDFLLKPILIGCVCLFGSAVFAQELNFQEYRKFLMQGNQGGSKKLAIQTTCTTSDGKIFRVGEKDYDTCLNSLRVANDQKQLSGQNGTPSGASAGATIHFGN